MNPYFCYIFSFAIALLTYSLGWSSIYPKITFSLQLFLLSTFLITGAAGYFWKRESATWKIFPLKEDRNIGRVTIFIYSLWLLDFLYEGGIPFFRIVFNQPYDYRLFGVPSLHVFTVTFSSFYTLYLFHLYIIQQKKYLLFLYLVNLFAAVLIYNRGMLFFNLAGSFLLLFFCKNRFRVRLIILSALVIPLMLYLFGLFGTFRVSRESESVYNNALFMETGQATAEFKQSPIPKEFFWSYIYITSPLANFQQNINLTVTDTLGLRKIGQLVTNEFMFDFISKRSNRILDLKPEIEGRIPGPFNVSTIYSRSFRLLRWYGIVAMVLLILFLPWVYARAVNTQSSFFLPGMAILCTMYLFMAYDNTIRFTGLSFQLVYPILFSWLKRKQLFSLSKEP